MTQRNLVPGLLLIGLGTYLALVQLLGIGAEAIVTIFGVGFLVAYALTRHYGFLVPAGIMMGLGLGVLWQAEIASSDAAPVIGLGLGFLFIYVADLIWNRTEARWWPVIPGGILTAIGALVQVEDSGARIDGMLIWPIVLIGIGVVLLLASPLRRSETSPTPSEETGVSR